MENYLNTMMDKGIIDLRTAIKFQQFVCAMGIPKDSKLTSYQVEIFSFLVSIGKIPGAGKPTEVCCKKWLDHIENCGI